MKKIGITGGKGGTGKSTVSILLANKLRKEGKKVVLCDCDVECPNDYLLLGQDLIDPKDKVLATFPKLNEEKCQKCGLCVKNCRSNAIFQTPGEYPIFLHALCSVCGLCWNLCPHEAIEIEEKVIGEIFENKIDDNFYLVTGRSIGVVDEAGPIVTKSKKAAFNLATRIKADYLLIDTSVGIHCGVIRALLDVDLAYAVTEPTSLGAHDLKLILELIRILKIPAEIVINQSDMGNKDLVDAISRQTGTNIEYEVPYSKSLASAYSNGKLSEVTIL